jgi:hypothetical protein
MNPAGADPLELLREEEQWTAPWGDSEEDERCDKCGGAGRTICRCWSCSLTGASGRCPVCHGAVRWERECPVCRGSGRIDGSPRRGISVYPTIEGLYHYMIESGGELDDCVVVELDAEPSQDVDFDADQGAMLVIPTAVRSCLPFDSQLAARVRRQAADLES